MQLRQLHRVLRLQRQLSTPKTSSPSSQHHRNVICNQAASAPTRATAVVATARSNVIYHKRYHSMDTKSESISTSINQDQPRHRDIEYTSMPSTSGVFQIGDTCHAITRKAGKETARVITRVAGKKPGFTFIKTREVVINTIISRYHARNT